MDSLDAAFAILRRASLRIPVQVGGLPVRAFLWATLLVAGPIVAAAQPVIVRLGTHGGFGRIVFEFPRSVDFTTDRVGNTVTLSFPGGGDVPSGAGSTRNITVVSGGRDTASVVVAPGARLHAMRLGNRIILDVLDSVPAKQAAFPAAGTRNRDQTRP